MKTDDNIESLFQKLENEWDTETPNKGHEKRFLAKLQEHNKQETFTETKKRRSTWQYLSIAASIALVIAASIGIFNSSEEQLVTENSSEVDKTTYYFASVIQSEMEKIQEKATPETKQMVDDAMKQIKKLENDYKKLENDLSNEGDSKKILNAMVINFQTRINLLQDVLEQMKAIKQLKSTSHEKQII